MKKILTVIGARPQFIKASVVTALLTNRQDAEEVVVHTGQHFDANMSDIFFSELDMPQPKYHLDIHGGTHGEMTGRMLHGIESVLMDESPDVVLVYGDTNSTLAAALAAVKLHVPVAHVEAGLRSFNMRMPEEVNRILTDRVSNWLFAPTEEAVRHLVSDGLDANRIQNVGDVMYDVALHHGERVDHAYSTRGRIQLPNKGYVLVTIHRAENTDDPERLKIIVAALIAVAQKMPVLWPLHPRTRAVLERMGLLEALADAAQLIEPLGYLEMVNAERNAAVIATDSGGVQKEAFFHKVPCVTLRDETEWVELVQAGWNSLVPPVNASLVADAVLRSCGREGDPIEPYGDGHAAARIVESILG